MGMLPDYSQWLTPERVAQEEQTWADPALATWPYFVRGIKRICDRTAISSVIEFGCGTGWVAQGLPSQITYLGIDANSWCLERARQRCPHRTFILADVRDAAGGDADLVCAFSFLKHFGFGEWDAVVKKVLSRGRLGLFSIPLASEDWDAGIEFPHVWVSNERMTNAVQGAGHRVLVAHPLPWGEMLIETCKAS